MLYLLQAGSTLTKVKLFVVNTTIPSRRTQVAPPASVASGSVYTPLSGRGFIAESKVRIPSTCVFTV